jgi:adenine-specific DNA-methyltransferase
MAWENVTLGDCRLIHGDALEVLPTLPSASVQLILVDPPYGGVKTSYQGEKVLWDRQWPTRETYLAWLRQMAKEWQRVLTPNGSLYCFAAPQMAAWVEVTLSEVFNILQRITWRKPAFSTKAEMFDKESCRMFFPASEAILFAEQYGGDAAYQEALVTENESYWTACQRLKGRIFGEYLKQEFTRAGVTKQQVAALFPSATEGLTGCVRNWLLGYNCPTPEQYHAIRTYLNSRNGHADYLRREYDYLRREYEDLRQEYEDLRRPFTVSSQVPYTDVWDYPTVSAAPGKHPAEKPLPLLRHIITASSRPGDTILDSCAGSFSTLDAARQCGRKGIGIEQERHWWTYGQRRLSQEMLFAQLPMSQKATPVPVQANLFAKGGTA